MAPRRGLGARRDRRPGGELRPGPRRLGRRPEVPRADAHRVPPHPHGGRAGEAGAAGDGAPHARRHGRRRHPRPAGRRFRALLDRRTVAGAPLREDALRQRPARPRLPPRVAADRRGALPGRRGGHPGLRGARPGAGRRCVRRQPGRRHRGRRRRHLHLDARGGRRATWGRSTALFSAAYDAPARRQLGGPHDPPPDRRGRAAGRALRPHRGGRRRVARGGPLAPPGRAPGPAAAGSRRQGARGLERPRDRRFRGSRPWPSVATTTAPPRSAPPHPWSTRLMGADGHLRRTWKDGRAGPAAVLEDHADLAEGLLALYEATFDERWFRAGRGLLDAVLERFADPAGGFFDTAADHETLITRPRRTSRTTRSRRATPWPPRPCCAWRR